MPFLVLSGRAIRAEDGLAGSAGKASMVDVASDVDVARHLAASHPDAAKLSRLGR
jgi:hypothetical protein